jgi:Tfp pilus assembly protein PilF
MRHAAASLRAVLVVAVLCAAAAAGNAPAALEITSPFDGAVFPRDIAAPTFTWKDTSGADAWVVTVTCGTYKFGSGRRRKKQWTVSEIPWMRLKKVGTGKDVKLVVKGVLRAEPGRLLSSGSVTLRVSGDMVGAPIFYREVNLPFADAVKDPSRIRWRMGRVSARKLPPVVLDNLPVCANCHSFSADGSTIGMDVDYANDKGSYAIAPVTKEIVLNDKRVITWSDFRRKDGEQTYGLLSCISPDGRYIVSTVKDRSVFLAKPEVEFSQLFFPVKGILAFYDRETKRFSALPGADDPAFVQSNPTWSPDGKEIVFARSEAFESEGARKGALLSADDCREFLSGNRRFLFDLYRIPFNGGKGGRAGPVEGASKNGTSNFFPKFSPDGKWIVFCRAKSYMLLQPDSELYIMPAAGGAARKMRCNTRRMNSWHSWSPNGRWLVFSSKAAGPYTQLFLAHVNENGRSSPPVILDRLVAPKRAVNIPEFVGFINDTSFFRAGDAFLRAGDLAGARGAYRKAVAMNPWNAEAHYNLGVVLAGLGEDDLSMKHYRKALAVKPDMADAHTNLGVAFEKKKQFDRALTHLGRALELDPESAKKHLLVARCLIAQGKKDDATGKRVGDHIEKALELSPRDVRAHMMMAEYLAGRNKSEEAMGHWRKAVEIDPSLPEPRIALARACIKRGRTERARGHLRELLAAHPDHPEVLKRRKLLEKTKRDSVE